MKTTIIHLYNFLLLLCYKVSPEDATDFGPQNVEFIFFAFDVVMFPVYILLLITHPVKFGAVKKGSFACQLH